MTTLGVGKMSIVEDLEQDVEHLGMGLFYFVQKDDTVVLSSHCLGELSPFIVAYVAWRCAHQPSYGMPLHELGHIQPDEGILTAKHKLRQGPHQLCLSHAGGAEEDEAANGVPGILHPGSGSPHRLGHGGDGLILPDDTLV